MKKCSKCKIEKENSEFTPDKRSKDGLFSYCKPCNTARQKEAYWKNLEESRRKNRERDAKNRDKARNKCSSFWAKKRKEDPAYCLWAGAKSRANKNNIEFDILREDIIIPEICPILGIKLQFDNTQGFSDTSPSIDKIDPNKGYVKDNIQIISWRANKLKSNGTLEEFKKLVYFLENL
jgi:hypothetical protein